MNDKIVLDKEAFKALGAETRVNILKTLHKRRHTQSELASDLGLSTPTIKEHLQALEKAKLVERHEEGRKWIYYSLTKKSKEILNPESQSIWILLGTTLFGVVGSIFTATKMFAGNVAFAAEKSVAPVRAIAEQEMVQTGVMDAADVAQEAVAEAAPAAEPVAKSVVEPIASIDWQFWLVLFTIITIISIVLLIYFVSKQRKYQRSLGKSLNKK